MNNARITREELKRPNGSVYSYQWTVWHDGGFRVFNSERAAKQYMKEGDAW